MQRLYAIIDRATLDARNMPIAEFASALRDAGVRLVQYRDKDNGPQEVLRAAREIADVFQGAGATLILNDRADLVVLAGWNGVHVGQEDMTPTDARQVAGPWLTIGVSTHSDDQVRAADPTSQKRDRKRTDPWQAEDRSGADYIAVGPIFATSTKQNASPVVGLEGVRRARALTQKPIVAIGGITRENARSVIDAGADSVAVIGGLFSPGESVEKVARDFLEILR